MNRAICYFIGGPWDLTKRAIMSPEAVIKMREIEKPALVGDAMALSIVTHIYHGMGPIPTLVNPSLTGYKLLLYVYAGARRGL